MHFGRWNGLAIVASAMVSITLLASATAVRAQSARVVLAGPNGVPGCYLAIPSGFVFLNVNLVASAGPIGTIDFRISTDCPDLSLSQTTFNLHPPCVTSGNIASFLVINSGSPVNCHFNILPIAGANLIMAADCDGYPMVVAAGCDAFDYIAPYRPYPPDGATDVPVNVKLSFVGPANQVMLDGVGAICYEGPFPPADGLPNCTTPIDPGLLLPNTTYKWVAYNHCYPCFPDAAGASSQQFTFTTSTALAIESASWGRVKARYRE